MVQNGCHEVLSAQSGGLYREMWEAAALTLLVWGTVTIILDLFGWVIIKHPNKQTYKSQEERKKQEKQMFMWIENALCGIVFLAEHIERL